MDKKNQNQNIFILSILVIFLAGGLFTQEKIDPNVPAATNPDAAEAEAKDEKPFESVANKVLPASFKGDQKENMNIEHLRSIFVIPEQMGALRKSQIFWLDDKLKIGFIFARVLSLDKMQTLIEKRMIIQTLQVKIHSFGFL